MWSAPLDPRQSRTVRADDRRSVKVRAFCQQMPHAVSQINGYQPMLILLFLNRQNLAESEMQIAITTLA
jgi:hypothetical protein